MNLSNEQSKKLCAVQIDMLKAFIEICKNNNLQYYMLYGSALGAVRHGGFIPWDDDIDVGMPREDYEKFITIARSALPEHYFLQHHTTDPDYPTDFAKIRDCRTTYIETTCKNIKMNHGIYMDVFPIDGYPEDEKVRKKIERKLFWMRISVSRYFYLENVSVKFKLARVIASVLYPSKDKTVEKIDELAKKIPFASASTVKCFGGAWGKREILPKELFGQGSVWSFEGIEVLLPENADGYLSHMYGDYMKLPPEEKRVPHHYVTAVDFDKPYTEY